MAESPITDSAAIDSLGGTVKTARLFKTSPNVVSNWRKRGIPARYHYAFLTRCQEKGVDWKPPVMGTEAA
jgi:hypothetical protein